MPHLTHFEAEMVLVLLAQQKFSDKVLGQSETHVGKTIERKLGINLNQSIFWKKLRFHAMTAKCSNSKIQTKLK